MRVEVSRREFLRLSVATGATAALGFIDPRIIPAEGSQETLGRRWTKYGRIPIEEYEPSSLANYFTKTKESQEPFSLWLGRFNGVCVQPQTEPTIRVRDAEGTLEAVSNLWHTSFAALAREEYGRGAIYTCGIALERVSSRQLQVIVARAESFIIDGQSNPGATQLQRWISADGVEWQFHSYLEPIGELNEQLPPLLNSLAVADKIHRAGHNSFCLFL